VKLNENGRPIFVDLMRRRGPFQFVAFDVLALNGKDVRRLELVERKRLLRWLQTAAKRSLPRPATCCARRIALEPFGTMAQDLEGIVAKRKRSAYDPVSPLAVWVKIKNAEYSQARDRHELFERN
jgi:ATP-dependent DNA ligase